VQHCSATSNVRTLNICGLCQPLHGFRLYRLPSTLAVTKRAGVLEKIVTLIRALYDKLVSCVRANGLQSMWFEIMSVVCQVCVRSRDSFVTGMDYLLERSVGIGMNGVFLSDHFYTDLDFADNVCLLA